MVRKLIMSGLAVMVAVGVATPASALGEIRVIEAVSKTTEGVVKTVEETVEDSTSELREAVKSQREAIEERKREFKAELEQKREDRKAKLEGRRLAKCQNREDNINSLIDKSITIGRERLAKIQRVEEGVKNFYDKQALSSDAYDAAVLDVDEKEAAAIAALDVIADRDFDCSEVDGEKPSDTIRSTHQAKREALDAYKASVKQLVAVVREAFVAKRQLESGAEN